MADIADVIDAFRRLDDERKPHPKAAALVFPDGRPAPAAVRAWAAFDNRWPDPLSSERGEIAIASKDGLLAVKSMADVFRYVCLESIETELEGDDDTLEHLEELAAELAEQHPGFGVLLDPHTTPDRFLWLAEPEPFVLTYENDAIADKVPFTVWLASLLE